MIADRGYDHDQYRRELWRRGGILGGVRAADAHAEAYGVVAVHTGSWGYREVVLGRGTTRQIANPPIWDVGAIALGYAPLAFAPVAVTLWTIKYRASEALRSGQCFAWVRPSWIPWPLAAKDSWGCR